MSYIKRGVSKAEANGMRLVYPSNLKNSLLLTPPVLRNNGKYNLHMKKLVSLENLGMKKLKFSNDALKMLENQFDRLHAKRPHSNLNANARMKPKNANAVRGLKRQILVNTEGTKGAKDTKDTRVKGMYLSDFNVRKTGNTVNDEKKLLQRFMRYVASLENNNTSTPKRLRRSPSIFKTPSPTKKSLFNSPNRKNMFGIGY